MTPLVRVRRDRDRDWTYECARCHRAEYTRDWRRTMKLACAHLEQHARAGFQGATWPPFSK